MYTLTVNDKFKFDINRSADHLMANQEPVEADVQELGGSRYHVIHQHKSYQAEVVEFDAAAKTASIKVNGRIYQIVAKDQFDALLEQLGMSNLNSAKVSELKAPMPGLVLKIFVQEGSEVKKGDNLFVLEAMKMENIIKAPADVTVKAIKIAPQDKVEKGQVLLQFA
ncbi:acetyl-CoA carboxylase biotin carboxyl carrier protein subunit [Mucilaginibacter koreensis]